MDASVVIPVKNGGELFKKVLNKVLSQETQYKYDVICVDSGSKDGTLEFLQSKPVRLFQIKPEEFGHGKTRNYGASKSDADFIVFITQDALPVDDNWLENLLLTINKDKEIAGVFGKHLPYPDCNIIDKHDLKVMFDNFDNKNHLYRLEDKQKYKRDEGYRLELAFFSDNNSCLRHSLFKQYPYPDVNFAEDQIWMKHMIEKGYKKAYAKDAAVYHSHNFSVKTLYGRFFDEFKGLYEVHKYKAVQNKKDRKKCWLAHTKNDILHIIRPLEITKMEKIKWSKYSLTRNYCRYYGGYKGGVWHFQTPEVKNKWDIKYSQQYRQKNK